MWMEISFPCLLPKLVDMSVTKKRVRTEGLLLPTQKNEAADSSVQETDKNHHRHYNVSFKQMAFPAFSFLRVWIDQWGGQGSLFLTLFTIIKTYNYRNQDDDISVASFVSRIGSITQRFLDSDDHTIRLIALSSSSVIAFSLFTYWRDFIIDTVHSQDIHTIVLFESPCLPGSINCPSFAWTDQSKRSFSFLRSLSHQYRYHGNVKLHDSLYQSLANSSIPDG